MIPGPLEPGEEATLHTRPGHVFVARHHQNPSSAPLSTFSVSAAPGGEERFHVDIDSEL